MPSHPDAVGYLNDLATEINEPWLKLISDLVIVHGVSALDDLTTDTLYAIYIGTASYIGVKSPGVTAAVSVAPTAPTDCLEQLSGFANFKLLSNTLHVTFNKRITLIFGANGTGKSSLCESLKVLATSGQPTRPLENVRKPSTVNPTFSYKFKSDSCLQTWTPASGFGPRRTTVKYFDTAIAIKNVTSAVEPGRVIVLAPFKLHVFEWAKALTTKFRTVLQEIQQDNAARLTQKLTEIRTEFAKFKGRPLALIDEKSVSVLTSQMNLGEEFKNHQLLGEKRAAAAELEKASSEEGLKLLRAEHRELESLLTALNTLLTSAAALWALEPANKAQALQEKQVAQQEIAKNLIPRGNTHDEFFALLRATSPLCKMDEAIGHICPLCKRDLGAPEVALFKQYHDLLVGQLENEITAIKVELTNAKEFATVISKIDRKVWEKCKTIPEEVLLAAMASSEVIIANCSVSKEPTAEAKTMLETLKASVDNWAIQLQSKKDAIETASKGREELVKQLAKLRAELEPMEYAKAIIDRGAELKEAEGMITQSQFWSKNMPMFTQILKRITEKAKDAHEDLVVTDFEARLEAEYVALAEKGMTSFGVVLARKGTDAAVTVLPQVGGRGIEGVLSEGEQRVHALALFFAELECCPQSVLVFDDPISSFDYNYIANFCARLRDFAVKHPERQILVLTHNWEFFVQFQTTVNQAGLDSHLSVNVLENCAIMADYSEKLDDLKNNINAALALSGEPTKPKKEELAGKMRRLIEAVVNTHVFNHQRHQYKQKSQAITAFPSFTKVVALLPAEATTLRDLYAKLSITEHDDPRNAYVNTDKAMFQTRYNQILTIEAAIKGRIPP